MTKKYKLLIDVSLCAQPYCGIQHDLCYIFKTLSQLTTVNIGGLALTEQSLPFNLTSRKSKERLAWINTQSSYWDKCLNRDTAKTHLVKTYGKFILNALNRLLPWGSALYQSDSVFAAFIWKNYFSKTIPPQYADLMSQQNFYMANISKFLIIAATKLGIGLKLDTRNWDFVLIQDQFPLRVSPNTIKLVRHHDMIPIIRPDKVNTSFSAHYKRALSLAKKDAFFICDSDPSRENLISLIPELEAKSCTIPCIIPPTHVQKVSDSSLNAILINRLSTSLLNKNMNLLEIKARLVKHHNPINYIFTIGTLEPRKNLVTLIRAWEYLRSQYDTDIKLVVLANTGWSSKSITKMMEHHIFQGNLIHLENIINEELAVLYANAKAFIFPSFIEGFGIPPLLAMQYACPTIVSDIKTHRWVLGDASLYCNPYDVISLKNRLIELLYSSEADTIKNTLIDRGLKRVQRYSSEQISQLWQSLFVKLKSKTKN